MDGRDLDADVYLQVLSGITFTKLIGMCVLALTRSKFLEVRILEVAVVRLHANAFVLDLLLPHVALPHHLRRITRIGSPARGP